MVEETLTQPMTSGTEISSPATRAVSSVGRESDNAMLRLWYESCLVEQSFEDTSASPKALASALNMSGYLQVSMSRYFDLFGSALIGGLSTSMISLKVKLRELPSDEPVEYCTKLHSAQLQ